MEKKQYLEISATRLQIKKVDPIIFKNSVVFYKIIGWAEQIYSCTFIMASKCTLVHKWKIYSLCAIYKLCILSNIVCSEISLLCSSYNPHVLHFVLGVPYNEMQIKNKGNSELLGFWTLSIFWYCKN
jgi:hypothetical protein